MAFNLPPIEIRTSVIAIVDLLSSAESQLEYEQDVAHAFIPSEIIELYCTDQYHPKSQAFVDAFTETEHKLLARLFGDAFRAGDAIEGEEVAVVSDALKMSDWRRMIETAKIMRQQINH